MINTLVKRLAPVAAIALSAAVAGCGDMNIEINGEEGVPLAELDMTGDAPTEFVLAGPDQVVLTEGENLEIDVEGDSDAVDLVRFSNKDGTLAVSRANGKWDDVGTAIVRVTMPAPTSIVIAGSGSVEAATMADEADITIAGSGRADVSGLEVSKLQVTIAGSGSMSAAGAAEQMELTIAGSGQSSMPDLTVGNAEVSVVGSGDASFASDGNVEATIMGSGNVTVRGDASCTISSMGSGSLNCKSVEPAE